MTHAACDTDNIPRAGRAGGDDPQTGTHHPVFPFNGSTARGGHRSAGIESWNLSGVKVRQLTCSPANVVRTLRQVRQFDREFYSLVLPRRGRVVLEQAGRQAVVDEGCLALYTTSRPFHVQIQASTGTASVLGVQIPHTLLPLPAPQVSRMLAVPVSGSRGVGALLVGFLLQLTSDDGSYAPGDLPRLANVLTDLLAATVAHQLEAEAASEGGNPGLLARVTAFVGQHLGDPALSPATIAAAHHISVSYLHRVFLAHHTTVAAWIRSQRLERARRDLTDPSLRDLPIHRIAARWGFGDHATFTRAFRAAFGVPPRDYRQTADLATVEHRQLTAVSSAQDSFANVPARSARVLPSSRSDRDWDTPAAVPPLPARTAGARRRCS